MALPIRQPVGARQVSVVSPNLFILAAQYLGNAEQWERIADLNAFPGVAPDFLLSGNLGLQVPAPNAGAGKTSTEATIESRLFGL